MKAQAVILLFFQAIFFLDARTFASCTNFNNIFVFGSSVALGVGATNNEGYAFMLGEEVQDAFGKTLRNEAVGGHATELTLARLNEVLGALSYVPQVVVIGLSTANEGLVATTTQAQADAIAAQFEAGMEMIVNAAISIGVETIIVGSVYPQNSYSAEQYTVLREVFDRSLIRLPQLGTGNQQVVVADFLTTLDDGNGHWNPGIFRDAGHPNSAGHGLMFTSINQVFYDTVDLPSFAAGTPCPSGSPTAPPVGGSGGDSGGGGSKPGCRFSFGWLKRNLWFFP